MSISRDRLIVLRGESGESQAQIGKELGVTNYAVCRWECGRNDIPAWAIAKLALHFNVTADYLLGLTNKRYRLNGGGIVHACHCANCGASIEYYKSIDEDTPDEDYSTKG